MSNPDSKRLVGLLGYPVAHSLSPAMHNEGFRELGINAEYILMPTPPADLPNAVEKLRDPKYLGANVTLPHKTAVIPLLDDTSELSKKLGAVNTIVNRNGILFGDTTDVAGFIAAFEDEGHSFEGKSVAILGNGGSARTIAIGLPMQSKVRRITLIARSVAKAAALADEVRAIHSGLDVTAMTLDDYAQARGDYDIVVNTTPVGMHPAVEETPLSADLLDPGQIIYDIVYNPLETRLLREARSKGCKTVGGLGMLIHQGKISFERWTGHDIRPEIFREGIRRKRELEGVTP
jgi:shikimate dehydrogenase